MAVMTCARPNWRALGEGALWLGLPHAVTATPQGPSLHRLCRAQWVATHDVDFQRPVRLPFADLPSPASTVYNVESLNDRDG